MKNSFLAVRLFSSLPTKEKNQERFRKNEISKKPRIRLRQYYARAGSPLHAASTQDSVLLFLAEFLESGIAAQGIPERIEPKNCVCNRCRAVTIALIRSL